MDWGNVTVEELIDALKEVEWTTPPRPLTEFFAKFTVPKSKSKWNSRVKCNLYFYRTNYFLIMSLILAIGFARNPLSLLAVFLTGLTIACLNDSFAESLSEKLTRATRQISPPMAQKLRPPTVTGVRGRPLKGTVYICGRPRKWVVIVFSAVTLLLLFLSCAVKTVLIALGVGLFLTLVHSSFRTPNLKARLNSFREEFRAVWRGYSDA